MISTNMALQRNPMATEMNPVLRPFADNPAAFKAVGVSIWAVANFTLFKIAQNHPRRATFIAMALTSAEIAITAHNVNVAQATRH